VTYEQCLADARDLKATMERRGVPCSIELVPSRGGDAWASVRKYVRMHHHVASYYKPGGNMTPMLYLVKQGRPDVPGPLANGYGGFDRVYRIICMGLANHPGLGGPITIDGVYIPKDSARGPTWGTEWEGGYQDWDSIPGMLEFMGRADNALAEWSGRPLTSQMEHKTWAPERKVDRKDFTRASGIVLTQKWSGGTTPTPPTPSNLEDLMPFPVIGAANDSRERPWRALLPGKVVTFVDWDPLPANTETETWAPGWAYYEGGAAGVFEAMKRAPGDVEYDRRVAVAQQYTRLP
jgi:hypothetical protein